MAQEMSTGWNLLKETDGASSLIGHNPIIIHLPKPPRNSRHWNKNPLEVLNPEGFFYGICAR